MLSLQYVVLISLNAASNIACSVRAQSTSGSYGSMGSGVGGQGGLSGGYGISSGGGGGLGQMR